jgi:hypothetical protein
MPIATTCPKCGKDYQLADKQAGRRVRCRQCQNDFEVPHKPDRLDAVAERPALATPRRAALPDEADEPLPSPLATPGTTNRTLLWVVGIIGGCLVLIALICAGVIWMVLPQLAPTADKVVAKQLDLPPDPPKKAVQPAPEVQKKEVEVALPTLKLPTGPPIKDLDDAVKRLSSPEQLVRLRALEYIGKQKPPADAAKKKAILDVVDKLTNDDDPFVKLAATQVKVLWEFD